MDEQVSNVVRAQRFELVDSQGETRAILGTGKNDTVGITFLGSEQTDRVTLGIAVDNSATLALQDQQGAERVKLSARDDGSVINIKDDQGNPRAQLQVREDGSSELLLLDEWQNYRATIAQRQTSNGQPRIVLEGAGGEEGVYAGVSEEGEPLVGLIDKSGEVSVAISTDAKDAGILIYRDEEGSQQRLF